MANTLVTPADLADFPGAPFADSVVDAAAGWLRRICDWHIAPSVSETVTVDARGGKHLFLPSLLVTAVAEVRDVSDETPVVVTGWRSIGRGMLELRSGCWPNGDKVVEVDLTHGYTECPPELLPAIAEIAQRSGMDRTVKSTKIDDFAEGYFGMAETPGAGGTSPMAGSAIDFFIVPRRTGA